MVYESAVDFVLSYRSATPEQRLQMRASLENPVVVVLGGEKNGSKRDPSGSVKSYYVSSNLSSDLGEKRKYHSVSRKKNHN